MAKIEDFIAFRAAIELHKDNGTADKIIKDTYDKCVSSKEKLDYKKNHVKNIYKDFSPEQISSKMSEMLIDSNSKIELDIIFQKVENLHKLVAIIRVIGILLETTQHLEEIKL